MLDLFQQCIRLINLPFTLLVAAMALYWLATIKGLVDVGSLDATLEAKSGVLAFLELGPVPFSVWLSAFAAIAWVMALNANWMLDVLGFHVLGDAGRLALGVLIYMPASGFLAWLVTRPFRETFKMTPGASNKSLVGKDCDVTSLEVTPDFGTASVTTGGAPFLINVRAAAGEGLRQGERARIFQYDEAANLYHVTRVP